MIDGRSVGDLRQTALVRVTGLEVRFGRKRALHDVNLEIEPATITSLIGPNGAGKSTLVRSILGIVRPSRGRVWRKPGLRIAYVPQKLSIDTALPMSVDRFLDMPRRRNPAAKAAILGETGIAAHAGSSIHTLSGGEFQRLLLARALLEEPDLLVLDEPAQNVDFGGQSELFALIARVRDRRECAVILVSHELHLVMAATDQVICLNHHVCCRGHPSSVSDDPAYRALLGPKAAETLAVYRHHHDHRHGLDGEAVKDGHDAA
jgi:zinc transport system ATP-binding protein